MRTRAEIENCFADRAALDGYRSFFLVGIGGAGMSALARMLERRGFNVRGVDAHESPETRRLQAAGIPIHIGQVKDGLDPRDAVVLSDAISLSSPEVRAAHAAGASLFRRSQVLGWLLRDKKIIAITGTHGKTTTTGMVGAGLRAAGLDPLIVVGASIPDFGGPVVEGAGEWAVVEACEAYDSLRDFDPTIVVLTNLELDHVDFHHSWEGLVDAVSKFVARIPEGGTLVYCGENRGATEIAQGFPGNRQAYDSEEWEGLSLPGRHNRLNASGAMRAIESALEERLDLRHAARDGVARFTGAERRLQVVQEGPITVIDDYAHHPTEIRASLGALRERYPGRRLIVVFQPHLYSRTEPLIGEFAAALSDADLIALTDIYPAREPAIPGVSSARIAERATKPVHYIPNRRLLPRAVAKFARPGDVVVGMGAGTISEFAPALVEELARNASTGKAVAVICGGDSTEREVSLLSGIEVEASLRRNGHDAWRIDVSDLLVDSGDLSRFTGPMRPLVAFLAVHGVHAEDGAIQGLFELLHIPYTGSGIQASALAMDKQLTKTMLRQAGVRTPEGVLVTHPDEATPRAPVVVKPNAQGSTVGLSFVNSDADISGAIAKALQYDTAALVEEWVVGMEISVPVLGDRALPPVEIAPASGVYDYESKYTPGATEEIVPARLPREVLEESQRIALMVHRALGCRGATRTDMIVRPAPNYEIVVLEVNTLPGLTPTSLLPNSARAAGIEFDDLVQWILQEALTRDAQA